MDIVVDDADVVRFLAGVDAWRMDELAYNIGQLLESSTKERIATEKAAPDGEPWAEWSQAYAATRQSRHSLLIGEGNPGLLESIQNYSSGPVAEVGTNLVYGAIHQFGGAGVGKPALPARPYLGVSDADRRDIRDLIEGDLAGLMR
jgi:phage virion morphogenesis protein